MLTTAIKDVFIRMNLLFEKLRGKCYDGVSAMSSSKHGIAKRISDLEPRAVYTHCYGHALNMAAVDTLKQSKLMKDALDTTREITKLIKYSPERDGIFQKLKETLLVGSTSGIKVLSALQDGQLVPCRVHSQHPSQLRNSAESLRESSPTNARYRGQDKDPRGGSAD